jgi:hypothetical protein
MVVKGHWMLSEASPVLCIFQLSTHISSELQLFFDLLLQSFN